jgi:hypothetical protein
LNLRPSGYEPDELPGCSTPRQNHPGLSWGVNPPGSSPGTFPGQTSESGYESRNGWAGGPGSDLLSHALRRSTMGAGGFHGRVRDGIGCRPPAKATRSSSPSAIGAECRFWSMSSGLTRASCAIAPWDYSLGMISMHGGILSSIGRLGPVSSTRCRASTPGLST